MEIRVVVCGSCGANHYQGKTPCIKEECVEENKI